MFLQHIHIRFEFYLLIMFGIIAVSCSNDDNADTYSSNIVGQWIGEYSYYNPVGGMKSQFLYVDFNKDGTGKLEYSGPTNSAISYFSYRVAGSTITCSGAHGSMADDYIDPDFKMTLRIEKDRLIPLDKYTTFILTRDGSVITTEGGAEVFDQTDLLLGVWIYEDKSSLVEFGQNNTYNEYVLDPPGSKNYSAHYTGSYEYNPVKKWLTLNGSRFVIAQLSEQKMSLETPSGRIMSYNRGTKSDIPIKQDITSSLLLGRIWSTRDASNMFVFSNGNKITYMENGAKVGSFGTVVLRADGTFSISGDKMYCTFSDVSWDYASSYPNMFPGWTAGSTVSKTYTVKMSGNSLVVTRPDGKTMYMYSD